MFTNWRNSRYYLLLFKIILNYCTTCFRNSDTVTDLDNKFMAEGISAYNSGRSWGTMLDKLYNSKIIISRGEE